MHSKEETWGQGSLCLRQSGTQIAGLERQGLKLNNSFIAVEVNITKAGDNVRTN